MKNYDNLLKPIKVNSLFLKNRIIAAPMGGGFVERHKIENIAAKARGGAAVVVLGSCNVDNDRSFIAPGWPGLYEPYMEIYMDQLNIIHMYGAKASIELMHAGLWAITDHVGKNPLGPVTMKRTIGKDADDAQIDGMTLEDMNRVADSFAESALSAKKLGFDICMLHFAHGWLPAQFLSPKFNKRTDEFGGSFENRIRFPMMIVDRVRKAVGPDYPIDMRISGDERCEDGMDPDEVIRFVQQIQSKIDMIHVSSGIDKYFDLTTWVESPQLYPHLINVELAAAMKKAVKIPVTVVGGITMPDEAEKILADGKADFIAMARPLLADPDWPVKVKTGKVDDIVPCLRCTSCYHVATEGFSLGCSVNPVFCREDRIRLDMQKPVPPKKIVIVGGGPAGLKAALTASEYGHSVILLEKASKLGGLANLADFEERKIDLRNYKTYLVNKVLHSGIDIRLNTEATPDMVKELKPEVLIVGVGSVPSLAPIKGIDHPAVVQALDVYENMDDLGARVAVIGGGEIGSELGLSIAETGRQTTIIEMTGKLAPSGNILYREGLKIIMDATPGLNILLNTSCLEITEAGLRIAGKDGKESFVEADSIVIATGMKPRKELADSFYGIAEDVRIIGDCMRPRKIDSAVYEGYFAVTSI